ncbi:MAG: S41 family peptidase [Anaerolineae bacterium]|jgi:carboxyl-terminal processing protease|nr:S41 family peptidase [Anaerolineae bacterium]
MRKVMIGIFIAALVLILITGSFAGGLVVGRLTGKSAASPTPPTPTETPTESTQDLNPTDGTLPVATPVSPETPETVEPGADQDPMALDYEMLRQVLDILNREFYGGLPDDATLSYGAIRGLLTTLDDPYTTFIEPDIAAIWNQDATGEFEGIGATVQLREDGYLEIVRPLPGQPAETVGLKAGDLVLSVDGVSILGMGLYEAIGLIRGPEGSEVTLEIGRPGEQEPFVVTIRRARIEMPTVESRMLENNIGYILLTEFDDTATERVADALQTLLNQGASSLVFDLRDNPGGYLNQAIMVSDLFLDQGIVAIERDSAGGEQSFPSRTGDLGETIPLAVLVNGGSASASEIVAGAIQDRGRAALIGELTLGKGSVQLPHNLSDGSQLRVTIARWYTPNNNSIHGEGLTPDIEVTIPEDTPVGEDPQLQRAVQYLVEGE